MPSAARPGHRAARRGRDLLSEVGDLVLPSECASCGRPGARWCEDCDGELRRGLFPDGPRLVRPDPCPPGLPPVWSLGPYAGPLRDALVAYKDADRRDLSALLAPMLRRVIESALDAKCPKHKGIPAEHSHRSAALVPVPSSPTALRRRGDAPLQTLVSSTVNGRSGGLFGPTKDLGLTVVPALHLVRRVADQAGLDHGQRSRNVNSAMAVRHSLATSFAGQPCIVVDDVVTTGATLAEAARALAAVGGDVVACSTIAATERKN